MALPELPGAELLLTKTKITLVCVTIMPTQLIYLSHIGRVHLIPISVPTLNIIPTRTGIVLWVVLQILPMDWIRLFPCA